MSRIGKLPIDIPAGVEIKLTDGNINVRGTLGTLSQSFDDSVNVKIEGKQIIVERNSETTTVQNMVYTAHLYTIWF